MLLSVRPLRTLRIIREPIGLACTHLEERFPTLDATRVPVSRSNGQRSGLEAGGGIPNLAATLLVYSGLSYIQNQFSRLIWTGIRMSAGTLPLLSLTLLIGVCCVYCIYCILYAFCQLLINENDDDDVVVDSLSCRRQSLRRVS